MKYYLRAFTRFLGLFSASLYAWQSIHIPFIVWGGTKNVEFKE